MASPDRFHGLLIVDKPAGWSSHDVVGRVRRLLGQRSVGHAGTLDPSATGVLPVAVGSALRALQFLSDASKAYRAEITFGVATDTLDGDGRMTQACEPPPHDRDSMERLLMSFVGPIEQIPPAYAAIKIDGTPLYERARRGELVRPSSRSVTIHALSLVEWNPPALLIDVDCSKGFYVRSFARDLGDRARSCAFLSDLIRTRVASFTLCDAWTISDLMDAPLAHEWQTIAMAPDAPALQLPAIVVGRERLQDWSRGKRWTVDASSSDGPVRVYDSEGNWLGIGQLVPGVDGVVLQPRKVIPVAHSRLEDSH